MPLASFASHGLEVLPSLSSKSNAEEVLPPLSTKSNAVEVLPSLSSKSNAEVLPPLSSKSNAVEVDQIWDAAQIVTDTHLYYLQAVDRLLDVVVFQYVITPHVLRVRIGAPPWSLLGLAAHRLTRIRVRVTSAVTAIGHRRLLLSI